MRKFLMMGCLAAVFAGMTPEGAAEEDVSKRQLARVQTLLKQVNAAKTAAEAALAESRARLGEREAEVARLQSELSAARAAGKASSVAAETAEKKNLHLGQEAERQRERLARAEEKLRKTGDRLRDTTALLQQTREEKRRLDGEVAARDARLSDLEARNQQLYQLNAELIERYEHEGLFSRILRSEPVTGLRQVRAENLAQEARVRNEDQHVGLQSPPEGSVSK